MNLGAIFIGLAILVVTVPYVLTPLVNERKKKPIKPASREKDGKSGQQDALAAIRDLDFDYQTGKVTQEDYEILRAHLVLEAAPYLQMKQQEEEKLDAMIRARLQKVKASVKCENCGGETHPQNLFCPTCGVPVKNKVGSEEPVVKITCPGCGKSVKKGDLFCTGCGTRVNRQSTTGDAPASN